MSIPYWSNKRTKTPEAINRWSINQSFKRNGTFQSKQTLQTVEKRSYSKLFNHCWYTVFIPIIQSLIITLRAYRECILGCDRFPVTTTVATSTWSSVMSSETSRSIDWSFCWGDLDCGLRFGRNAQRDDWFVYFDQSHVIQSGH